MAGIFGVCHFDDRPIDPALIARMSATLARDERDGEALVIEGSTALGSRVLHEASASAPSAQPVRSSSGTRLVFEGRLDNRDELITALRDRFDVSPATSDAELAAACYEINGLQFAGPSARRLCTCAVRRSPAARCPCPRRHGNPPAVLPAHADVSLLRLIRQNAAGRPGLARASEQPAARRAVAETLAPASGR